MRLSHLDAERERTPIVVARPPHRRAVAGAVHLGVLAAEHRAGQLIVLSAESVPVDSFIGGECSG
jgi:hypothetical protein